MRHDLQDTATKIISKFSRSAAMARQEGLIPYKSENGRWISSPYDGNSWWTGGFWPALMWQCWKLSGNDTFMQEARRAEELLAAELRRFEYLNHDVGFMYLIGSGADYKLTGSEQARTDTMHAASLLMGRFNPAGFIRAWNDPKRMGWAIIDCMMNLSILYWATRQTGDPRFANVANVQAHTAMREFVR